MDSSAALKRLARLGFHLTPGESSSLQGNLCSALAGPVSLDTCALARFIAGEYEADRNKIFAFLQSHPNLITPVEISKDEHRKLCFEQLVALVRTADVKPFEYLVHEPARYFAVMDAISQLDLSLTIKMGVQFSLWGGSVYNLGTEKHRRKYFDAINNLEYPGCFAMTELHHGSNVQGIQTTATYDKRTQEFIINTPNDGATKWWIGNAALHGKFATVFARLKIPSLHGEEDHGVHAFIVPIRDLRDHSNLPGVVIRDCGFKVGLNGIDNGALQFCNVRIPRENLLDRFGSVDAEGNYSSPLPLLKRFGATLGELTGGRVALASGSSCVLQTVITIAIRYSVLRRQFGPPNEPEVAILDYQSHQLRLMPILSSAYAFLFAKRFLISCYSEMKRTREENLVADVHVLSAGFKAQFSSYTARAINTCREATGGHGYAGVNRFGVLRNDHDIYQTFEGDNTVLWQQVATDLLKRYKDKFSGCRPELSWSYLKARVPQCLSQSHPLTRAWSDPSYLRQPQVQIEAFQHQTAKLLHSTAMRLAEMTAKHGAFQAWNLCLNQLLSLAESHIDCVVLLKFIDAVNRCTDPQTKAGLKLLCDLYAVDRLWQSLGAFRVEDAVPTAEAKAVQRELENICKEARVFAKEYVDAFDIPDFLLRAPIGLQNTRYTDYLQNVGFQ